MKRIHLWGCLVFIHLSLHTEAAYGPLSYTAAPGQSLTVDCVTLRADLLRPPDGCIRKNSQCDDYRMPRVYLCRDECKNMLVSAHSEKARKGRFLFKVKYTKAYTMATVSVTVSQIQTMDYGLYICTLCTPSNYCSSKWFHITGPSTSEPETTPSPDPLPAPPSFPRPDPRFTPQYPRTSYPRYEPSYSKVTVNVYPKFIPSAYPGYPPYGHPFPPYGHPFPPYGHPFPPYGHPFPPYGHPFPPYGHPFPPYGHPFPPYGPHPYSYLEHIHPRYRRVAPSPEPDPTLPPGTDTGAGPVPSDQVQSSGLRDSPWTVRASVGQNLTVECPFDPQLLVRPPASCLLSTGGDVCMSFFQPQVILRKENNQSCVQLGLISFGQCDRFSVRFTETTVSVTLVELNKDDQGWFACDFQAPSGKGEYTIFQILVDERHNHLLLLLIPAVIAVVLVLVICCKKRICKNNEAPTALSPDTSPETVVYENNAYMIMLDSTRDPNNMYHTLRG